MRNERMRRRVSASRSSAVPRRRAFEGRWLTFRAEGAKVWLAAGLNATATTLSTASSMFLLAGDRWDALITRDRIVMKLKASASSKLKYAET